MKTVRVRLFWEQQQVVSRGACGCGTVLGSVIIRTIKGTFSQIDCGTISVLR